MNDKELLLWLEKAALGDPFSRYIRRLKKTSIGPLLFWSTTNEKRIPVKSKAGSVESAFVMLIRQVPRFRPYPVWRGYPFVIHHHRHAVRRMVQVMAMLHP